MLQYTTTELQKFSNWIIQWCNSTIKQLGLQHQPVYIHRGSLRTLTSILLTLFPLSGLQYPLYYPLPHQQSSSALGNHSHGNAEAELHSRQAGKRGVDFDLAVAMAETNWFKIYQN
ncbi:hypothetical protein ILYODFUR_037742 [Ilyodon furcidens]|uniref:Uncharacterized protein n=1 Tax=Ilyodon furcidens TaxID=33524 RepID=A0ABV0VLX9_9TELE